MIKRIALLSVMLAGSASAQQNMDISEKDVTSGAAQARLSALARDAAASGKRVVVTAPQHLHAQIAAGLSAGGKADIVLKDGFYENVLVRVVDAPAEAPVAKPEPIKPAPKPVASPPPVRAPAPAPSRPVTIPAPAPAPPPVQAAPAPRVEPSPAVPVETTSEQPVDLAVPPAQSSVSAPAAERTPPPAAAAAAPRAEAETAAPAPTSGSVFVATEPGDLSPARASLEKLYNDGKRISETIVPGRLINGDLIYTGDGAAVVVRRERPSLIRFWLDGSLDLDQSAIDAEGKNKYRVIGASVR